jgi:hypothetical protein
MGWRGGWCGVAKLATIRRLAFNAIFGWLSAPLADQASLTNLRAY